MWREKGLNVRNNGYFVITEFPIFIVDVMNYHPWKHSVSCSLSVEESACSIEMKIEGAKEKRKKREGKSPIQILALDLTRAQITFCVNTRDMIKMKYMSGSSILNNEYLHSFQWIQVFFLQGFSSRLSRWQIVQIKDHWHVCNDNSKKKCFHSGGSYF